MGVKIKRERPDQRRHHRVTAPLFVGVAGHTVRAADWSLGGLRIDDFPGTLPAIGSEVELKLSLPFQGFDVAFGARGRIVRRNAEQRMVALQFTELGERERELMQHFLEELVRGSMSDVEDTIQRIDVPVTPASLQPDTKIVPAGDKPVSRMPAKTMAMIAVYGAIGLCILSYTALLIYSNVFRLEVQSAVISAPIETVEAQSDGRIAWASVKPGDVIKQGEVILNVIDHQLEREIELTDIAIRERKARLGFLKQRYVGELEKLEGLTALGLRDMQNSKLDIESAEAQARAARRQYDRLKALHDKGFATDARLEEAEQFSIRAIKTLEMKKNELSTRVEMAGATVGKRYYNGRDIVGNEADVHAEMQLAENEILLAQQRHIANLNLRQNASVRAPFSGTVLELPRVDTASVRKGDVIAIIEQARNRHVLAFLKQDEVSKVGLGDAAQVFIPALGETVEARVVKIDRTSGFVAEQDKARAAGYRWRGAEDRSAKIMLEFASSRVAGNFERYHSGLPVTVVFEQRSRGSLARSLTDTLSSWL